MVASVFSRMVASVPRPPAPKLKISVQRYYGNSSLKTLWILCEKQVKVGQTPATSRLTPTVMNMENGRCSCLYRPLWTWRTVGVRWLSQCFRLIYSPIRPNFLLDIARLSACRNIPQFGITECSVTNCMPSSNRMSNSFWNLYPLSANSLPY